MIGLGTGTIAAYGRTGDYYRYYEINPLVLRLSQPEPATAKHAVHVSGRLQGPA